MIPDTLNPEIHVTKIEIQNEIKTAEIKKSDNKCLSSVQIHEILKQENTEEHENNTEIINVINVDTPVSNVQEHRINAAVTNVYRMEKMDANFKKAIHGYPGSKEPAIYPEKVWVQFHMAGAMSENSPFYYDPDRNSFVAIVFTITFVMLVITASFVGYIYQTDHLRDYFIHDGKYIFYVATGGMIFLYYTMMCSPCARMLPCNVVMLVIVVTFMSLIASYVTARYKTDIIFLAFVVTAITVLLCLCLALTSFDFTSFLLYIIGISVAFAGLVLVVAIVQLITGVTYKPLHLAILVVGTILNVISLITELQMILGGKTVELSEDDWALAAFMLYTSIVDTFLKIVQLAGFNLDDD